MNGQRDVGREVDGLTDDRPRLSPDAAATPARGERAGSPPPSRRPGPASGLAQAFRERVGRDIRHDEVLVPASGGTPPTLTEKGRKAWDAATGAKRGVHWLRDLDGRWYEVLPSGRKLRLTDEDLGRKR